MEVVVAVIVKRSDVDWIVGELWMTKPDVDVRRMGHAEQDDDDKRDASFVGRTGRSRDSPFVRMCGS